MTDSRTGAGNVQNESGASYGARKYRSAEKENPTSQLWRSFRGTQEPTEKAPTASAGLL